MTTGIVLSADIGGSHITTALVDMESRVILPGTRHRTHIDAHGSVDDIMEGWTAVMQQTMHMGDNVQQIGIAMPGPFDYEEGISLIKGLHKYEALYGLNVKEMLADRLQVSKAGIRFTNDASCFLQGELFAGAAKGERQALGLTLGTGFGSSIAEDGMALEGTFWKTPFRETTAEEYFSTRWFLRRYQALSGEKMTSVREMAGRAQQPGYARTVFEEFGSNLGQFLLEQQPLPSLIILGGNIAQSFALFGTPLQAQLPQARFMVSSQGEDGILLGAAGKFMIPGP